MGDVERSPASTPAAEEAARVDAMRVATLYQRAPVALATVVVNAAVLAWLVDDAIPAAWRWSWYAALLAISAARAADVLRYRARRPDRPPTRDEAVFTAGALANGLGWGLGGVLFVTDDFPRAVLVAAVIGGMVAGASASTATSRRAYFAFALPAFVPVAARFLLAGEPMYALTGVMLVVFGVAMSAIARQGGAALIRSEQLRLRNEALAAELERRSTERSQRLRLLLDRAGAALLVVDPGTLAILDVSEPAASLSGASVDALTGATLDTLAPLGAFGGAEALTALLARAADEGTSTEEAVWSPEDGGPKVHLRLTASVAAVGGATYGLVTLEDVSERRRLEAQLAQASLLASVGTLAAGVAHEVNNPLSYILGNLHHLRERLAAADAEEGLPEVVDEVIEGAERIRRIVKDLTLTTRSEGGGARTADVERVLASCLEIADNELRHRARVERAIGPAGAVAADPLRLSQILLNLLLNAAQAIEPGDAERQRVTVRTWREGERAFVSVADTGAGIDPGHLDRIFEPLFTTKPVGQGTGLGLSVCHALVTAAGGRITVESERGVGTTFTVALPAAAAAEAAAERTLEPTPRTAPRRVLVVDDDAKAARAVARVLRDHEVQVVHRAADALALLDDGAVFDVIFCDVMMPEMTGIELYRAYRERWPDRVDRIVFLTGGAFTDEARRFLDAVENPCLDKPFDVGVLRALVAGAGRPTPVVSASSPPPAH